MCLKFVEDAHKWQLATFKSVPSICIQPVYGESESIAMPCTHGLLEAVVGLQLRIHGNTAATSSISLWNVIVWDPNRVLLW